MLKKIMRSLPFLGAFLVFSVPAVAAAAPFGLPSSIIPEQCQNCAVAWKCVLATFDNVIAFALAFAFILATLLFAYAGFTWVLSPTSPSNIAKGKKILWNTVIGLIITMAAWLIVNTVLSVFTYYTVDSATNMLTGTDAGDWCLPDAKGDTGAIPDSDKQFTYQANIILQKNHASYGLNQLLTCMVQKVPGNVGQISSISDSAIVLGTYSWANCRAGKCAHAANSCHYGGTKCGNASYAVDFGDEQNKEALMAAAKTCGASKIIDEGDHIHVSVGKAFGCGCD